MSEEKKMAYLLERYNKRILCGDPWEPVAILRTHETALRMQNDLIKEGFNEMDLCITPIEFIDL